MKQKQPNKPERNKPCPCGSGQKYKYCCIWKSPREIAIPVWESPTGFSTLSVNFTNDMLNVAASESLPLKIFCKDNDIYHFGLAITYGQEMELAEKLRKGILTRQDVLDCFKSNFAEENITRMLQMGIDEFDVYKKRELILKTAFLAHYRQEYVVSIPTLFAQLEGMLRDVGNLAKKDTFKSTIPTEIWDERMVFWVTDDSRFYNGFIQKLFLGSPEDGDTFNRSAVLHGFTTDYATEENSMLLMLAILEIRLFAFWEKQENVADRIRLGLDLKIDETSTT